MVDIRKNHTKDGGGFLLERWLLARVAPGSAQSPVDGPTLGVHVVPDSGPESIGGGLDALGTGIATYSVCVECGRVDIGLPSPVGGAPSSGDGALV